MPDAILLQDVETLGEQGNVVDVSKGYLRNYLMPRKLAQPATKGAVEAIRQRQEAADRAERNAIEKAEENVNLLNQRDQGSARPEDRQTQRAPAGADQERRHLHGRRRGRRRRSRDHQDDGRREELAQLGHSAPRPAPPPPVRTSVRVQQKHP